MILSKFSSSYFFGILLLLLTACGSDYGSSSAISTANELKLPEPLRLEANADNEPGEVWSFTDPALFSGKVSGVELLPNGNRLITEGDFGFWEVTEVGEAVWKFKTRGFLWRGYLYAKDSRAIRTLGL